MKNVMILTGAGQIGMAIARRMGYGMKIVIGDKNKANAEAIVETMNKAGFDTVAVEMDLSSRTSILSYIFFLKYFIHCSNSITKFLKKNRIRQSGNFFRNTGIKVITPKLVFLHQNKKKIRIKNK